LLDEGRDRQSPKVVIGPNMSGRAQDAVFTR
jgi:hypothetical protein